MHSIVINFCFFLAGLLGFFGWSEYIDDQMSVEKYKGEVVQKIQNEKVLDIGSNVITQPNYKIVLSTGKSLFVSRSIFQKLKKGDYAVLIKQKDRITLSK